MSDKRDISSIKPAHLQPPAERLSPSGLLAVLPEALGPWVELTRLHKPTGVIVIHLPYQLGLLYAATSIPSDASNISILVPTLVLIAASVVLRSGGCTWNDFVDYKIDREVTRSRSRPVARGVISPAAAGVFAVVQLLVWLGILWWLNPRSLLYAIPNIPLVLFYPYAKRCTDFPQVVLGLTLAWGLWTGNEVMRPSVTISRPGTLENFRGLAWLSVAYVAWTTIYDTIYAFQDIEDDIHAGVRSMAVRWRDHAKSLLSAIAVLQIISLSMAGYHTNGSIAYYTMACLATAVTLSWMIWDVDLGNPHHCAWWFKYGILLVGTCMLTGLIGAYCERFLLYR